MTNVQLQDNCNAPGWVLVIKLLIYRVTICIDGELYKHNRAAGDNPRLIRCADSSAVIWAVEGGSLYFLCLLEMCSLAIRQFCRKIQQRSKKIIPFKLYCILEHWMGDICPVLMDMNSFFKAAGLDIPP